MTGRYAEGTTVSVQASQGEIMKTIGRYGATRYVHGYEDNRAMIMFGVGDVNVRFLLDLPAPDDPQFERTETGRTRRDPHAAFEAEARRRWRALALMIKAKLEAIETGITTFEEEFLAHIVLPDSTTVGEHVISELNDAWRRGVAPGRLLPALPAGKG